MPFWGYSETIACTFAGTKCCPVTATISAAINTADNPTINGFIHNTIFSSHRLSFLWSKPVTKFCPKSQSFRRCLFVSNRDGFLLAFPRLDHSEFCWIKPNSSRHIQNDGR